MLTHVDQKAGLGGLSQDLLELLIPATPLSRISLIMLLASLTSFACVALLTVPGLIFSQPDHNTCFLFSRTLVSDHASFFPICLSGLSSAFALVLHMPRVEFGRKNAVRSSDLWGPEEDWHG